MKKVLILTTSTGQGHNQAANSLVQVLESNGFECIKHDFLKIDSKIFNDIIVYGYELSASKIPHIYGIFYKLTNHKYINNLNSLIFYNTQRKLLKVINKEQPDLIIATHPFVVNIIGNLKAKGLDIPFISIVTDFKAHYTYINPFVDAYITASESTKESLVKEGIDKNIVYPIGIPIRENFFEKDKDIPSIKDNDYFSLLLMSGSMGLKSISYVLDELLKNPNKLRITVVCGKNDRLRNSLLKKCKHNYPNKKLHILGFSNDISSFMEYSDVLISKPGGLTVSEAIAKNLPLIIPFVIPGQEMENTDFLVSNGYAYYVKDLKSINTVVNELINNPDILDKMRIKLKNLSSTYSTKEIVDISNHLINKKDHEAIV